MSSMDRISTAFIALFGIPALTFGVPAHAQQPHEWDQARASLVAQAPGRMSEVVRRWETLSSNSQMGFDDYASFLITYPGFPQEDRIRRYAENALERQSVSPERLVTYFDAQPPLTNPARARYALALATMGRSEARDVARQAWRGGKMSTPAEAYISNAYSSQMSRDDQDARMDALLWQGEADMASRQIVNTSPDKQSVYLARLSMLRRADPASSGISVPGSAAQDPGYIWNLTRYYANTGQNYRSIQLLSNRPSFASLPRDSEDLVTEMLRVARSGGSQQAVQIASKVDDLFPPDTDIRTLSYRTRDDYTSLMWLGGTKALWTLGNGAEAAPLFYRYGAAARTPQTRSKGFYWAGKAASMAGNQADAKKYYEMAATYPDRFYGMLAMQAMNRPMPDLSDTPHSEPSRAERAAFNDDALVLAVREVARNAPWKVGIQFYNTIADRATTEAEHVLVSDLARDIGRRDLAVILSGSAEEDGHKGFTSAGYPTLPNPPGTNWTMVHAIARQESQFAQNAISHAGARGLMQLMPGTAREQAGKFGMRYLSADLINSPSYNMRLGDGYFSRMMDYYGGSYPLAVAAYNAGPGNVNKWLAANGDPRRGGIDWVTWVERIPIYETKNYVQRVLENAVVYETLYPDKGEFRRSRTVNEFLR
ncbi:MAG: lytic transglycosylase domain-containing protein [Sphingomonadaceae bacterium]